MIFSQSPFTLCQTYTVLVTILELSVGVLMFKSVELKLELHESPLFFNCVIQKIQHG